MERYAYYPTEFGYIKIGCTPDAVTALTFVQHPEGESQPMPLTDIVFRQVRDYLDGGRQSFDFPYILRGTAFQQKVWKALLEIPYGETRTYGEIAAAIGSPKACRAVGMANRRNPIWIVVPCHRVVGAGGSLTGYAGGLAMKEALLQLERKNRTVKR